jgi:hypothetical protein
MEEGRWRKEGEERGVEGVFGGSGWRTEGEGWWERGVHTHTFQ